jgi:hypothetical protein
MKLRLGLWLAIVSAPSIGAATIDVSADTSAIVRTGDTLVFHLLTSNFALAATAYGLPANPSEVSFALVSLPLSAGSEFAATLESADRGMSVAFGDLTFGPGYFEGSGYAGDVSTLQGRLSLSTFQSEVLFGSTSSSTSAIIALRNQGPDVELGLAPYSLRQSLYASLTGGSLSVGAVPGSVDLEGRANRARVNSFGAMSFSADTPVPEPQSGGLFLLGGALLCGISAILPRISGRPALPREKSTVCIR